MIGTEAAKAETVATNASGAIRPFG